MSRLLADAISMESASLESMSLEQLYSQESDNLIYITNQMASLEAMETELDDLADTMESLELAIEEYNNHDSLSVETQSRLKHSLEGYVDGSDLSIEAMSGWWNRMKQVYVDSFHQFIDNMSGLIRGWDSTMKSHDKINRKLMAEWAGKKRDVVKSKQKGSYAGTAIYLSFMADNKVSRDPIALYNTDIKYAEYMLSDYTKDIGKYLSDLKGIINSGDYTSDDKFESSVLDKVIKLGHPRDVFTMNDLVSPNKHPLVTNRGLEETKAKVVAPAGNDAKYQKLSEMADGRHIKQFVFTMDNLFGEGAGPKLYHDIELTNDEIDAFLALRARYINLVMDSTKNRFLPILKDSKALIKSRPKIGDDDALSGPQKTAASQINKLAANLKWNIMRPMRMEVLRIITVTTGSRTFISRMIATAE